MRVVTIRLSGLMADFDARRKVDILVLRVIIN